MVASMSEIIQNIEFNDLNKFNNRRGKPKCKAREEAKAKGETYYFNGKACKHGHITKRVTRTGYCLECQNTRVREQGRDYSLRSKYNITLEQYEKLLANQNGVCALCGLTETAIDKYHKEIKSLAVDHCHETGKVRGLLCSSCNIGIGNLKHNPELLRKAALYCEEANGT